MKGILFKPNMIKAIVEGKKTQTRRVIKPQPHGDVWFPDTDFHLCTSPRTCFLILNHVRYQVGDVVYIKEAFFISERCWVEDHYVPDGRTFYKGDMPSANWQYFDWTSPLFMPEKFARYFITITDARAERLQEITHEDAVREGCPKSADTPRYYFHVLWDSINKLPYDWASNPWCWVYTFQRYEVEVER